jgi:hypothetical protein
MIKKLSGGGMHSEYCPLCLLPYEDLPEIDYDEEEEEDEDEEKLGKQLPKLSNDDVQWLRNGLAFDRETNTILPVEGDNYYGEFPIKGRKSDLFTSEMTIGNDGDAGWGPVYHEDCIKCIGAQLNRPITYEDGIEIFKLVERQDSPYWGQHFEWEDAIESEGPAYFYSPMVPQGKEARERINSELEEWISRKKLAATSNGRKQLDRQNAEKELLRLQGELQQALASQTLLQARIKSLRLEIAARQAASLRSPASSPPKPQAKKRVSKKAAKPLTCPSHKTKEECNLNDCVWGKTNKCSKKRSKKSQ